MGWSTNEGEAGVSPNASQSAAMPTGMAREA
jgi:hypothetical protein